MPVVAGRFNLLGNWETKYVTYHGFALFPTGYLNSQVVNRLHICVRGTFELRFALITRGVYLGLW